MVFLTCVLLVYTTLGNLSLLQNKIIERPNMPYNNSESNYIMDNFDSNYKAQPFNNTYKSESLSNFKESLTRP
ncbi:putative SP-containing protein [Vairimorpha necatrix]|uniref:SP-containing protein n=1 Tax=Vairimorpha necatrix TaxID=6039 RepID=A0AAX4JE36_9MICR